MRFGHFRRVAPFGRCAVALIRFYQKWLSGAWGARCIYTPSCSEYGAEAIMRFGLLRGLVALFFRVIRCVPRFYVGGDDPLIERFSVVALLRKLKPNVADRTDERRAR